MEIAAVTDDICSRALALGACSVPNAGTPIEKLTFSQLCWAEDRHLLTDGELAALPRPSAVIRGRLPLWGFSGDGDGDGDGSGDGDGDGDGSGVRPL